MKFVIGILSYQMPHLTDSLVNQLKNIIKIPYHLIVLDNGSDENKIAASTTFRFNSNVQMTGGFNKILELAKIQDQETEDGIGGVWLLTNDIQFQYASDPLLSLTKIIGQFPDIGVVHPSLIEPVKNYAYSWMCKIPQAPDRVGFTTNHTMVDIIAPLYSRKALEIMDWKFDSRFVSWGIDFDSCYQVRKAGLQVAVDFDTLITHQTSAVYDAGQDPVYKNRNEYYRGASENMEKVFIEKYGTDWRKIIGLN